MDARFALVAGVIVLGTAGTVVLTLPHEPAEVFPKGKIAERQVIPTLVKTASVDSKAADFYGENVRGSMFARPLPTREAAAPTETTAPSSDSPQETGIHSPAPDSFAEYVYTGIVTAGGQTQGLLENARTKEGWYLRQGDAFMGAKVVQVDADAVTLSMHGQKRRIPRATAYNLVPLNAQARSSTDPGAPASGATGATATQPLGLSTYNNKLSFLTSPQASMMTLGKQSFDTTAREDIRAKAEVDTKVQEANVTFEVAAPAVEIHINDINGTESFTSGNL